MAIIRFHGDLQRFGRVFKLEVTSPAEAFRALIIQIPGLRKHLNSGHYRLRIDKGDLDESGLNESFHLPMSSHGVIHIVPVIGGAKNGGLFSVIAGVALIVSAFYTGGASIAAWGASTWGTAAAGAGMMLSGATAMLAPTASLSSAVATDNGAENQYFNSLENKVAIGSCVPLIYGEVMAGSKILSQGLQTG